jgi:4'-phosphopantetheinyl transferase EntD
MPADAADQPSPANLIGALLPSPVAAAESRGAAPAAGAGLFAAEREAVRTAAPERQRDFTAGRLCARAALARLGVGASPILPGPAGEPRWPAGVTGSITHCAGYRACAVALTGDVGGIGIDAEPDQPLPAGLLEAVAAGPERARVAELSAGPAAVSWDRLLFSAKEAAAKLWYPLTGQWPALRDVAIALGPGGAFTARPPEGVRGAAPGPAGRLSGRWLARGGLIMTAVTCPPVPPGRPR